MITVEELRSFLGEERVKTVMLYESVPSTNTLLKDLATKGEAVAGTCVIADGQTAGKGRRGRRFASPKGKGLYLSVLLDTENLPAGTLAELTAWGAVATAEAIEEVCGVSSGIKWVNDLVYDRKKLCGILTELCAEGDTKKVIMGIGINVNGAAEDFPEEIAEIATSLYQICGKKISRAKLCAVLIQKLDQMCLDFPEKKADYLAAYRERCAVLGKTVTIEKPDGVCVGTAERIDEDFRLVIRLQDGTTETLNNGEVSVKGFYGSGE